MEILPFKPIALEGIDDLLIGYYKKKGELAEDVKLLPEGKGWLDRAVRRAYQRRGGRDRRTR